MYVCMLKLKSTRATGGDYTRYIVTLHMYACSIKFKRGAVFAAAVVTGRFRLPEPSWPEERYTRYRVAKYDTYCNAL